MVHDALLSSTNHRIGNMDSCSFGGSLGDNKRSSVDVKVSVGIQLFPKMMVFHPILLWGKRVCLWLVMFVVMLMEETL